MCRLSRILRSWACLSLSASALALQEPTHPPEERGLVQIVVVDGVDRTPIGGARLAVDFEPPAWVRELAGERLLIESETREGAARWWLGTTDRQGRAWAPMEDGRLAFDRVVAGGYRPGEGLRGIAVDPTQPTCVEVVHPACLAGSVTGELIEAARVGRGARLRLRPLALRSGHRIEPIDPAGRFVLTNVAPWTDLRAEVLLPNGEVLPLEVGLRLDPDETRRVHFDLDARPALEGTVVAADGEARVVATEVLALPLRAVGDRTPAFIDGGDPWIFATATVARGGAFRFPALPPGDYWLGVWTESRLFAVVGDPLRVTHGAAGTPPCELRVVRARRVTGMLRDDRERPVAHALLEGRHLVGGQRRLATTQHDGTFTLGPFPLGPVEILREGETLGQFLGTEAGILVGGRR